VTVDHLLTLVAQRNQFLSLAEHPHFDADFFSAFKQILASSPREGAILKEQQVVAFEKAKKRRRGKKMIHLLKKEWPKLYVLETAWLDSLVRQKRGGLITVKSRSISQGENSGFDESGGISIPWWAIGLGLFVLSRILRALGAIGAFYD